MLNNELTKNILDRQRKIQSEINHFIKYLIENVCLDKIYDDRVDIVTIRCTLDKNIDIDIFSTWLRSNDVTICNSDDCSDDDSNSTSDDMPSQNITICLGYNSSRFKNYLKTRILQYTKICIYKNSIKFGTHGATTCQNFCWSLIRESYNNIGTTFTDSLDPNKHPQIELGELADYILTDINIPYISKGMLIDSTGEIILPTVESICKFFIYTLLYNLSLNIKVRSELSLVLLYILGYNKTEYICQLEIILPILPHQI